MGDFSVFITDQTDQIAWSTYSSTGAAITNFAVTTNAKNVYVVANAGDLTSSITTMAQLNAYKADLNGTGSQAAATNRWATGVTASPLSFTQSGNNFTATTTVTLTFIAARITVTVDNQMANYGSARFAYPGRYRCAERTRRVAVVPCHRWYIADPGYIHGK